MQIFNFQTEKGAGEKEPRHTPSWSQNVCNPKQCARWWRSDYRKI